MSKDNEYVQVWSSIKRKRKLRVAYNISDGNKIPAIRFSGAYLGDLGFEVGNYYTIEVNEDGSITVRPVDEAA